MHLYTHESEPDVGRMFLRFNLRISLVTYRLSFCCLVLVANDIRSNANPLSILALILVRVSSIAHLALQIAEAHSRPDKRNVTVTKDADVDVVALQLSEWPRL
jgi:hypothetical protein